MIMNKIEEISNGVFSFKKYLLTKDLTPNLSVFKEKKFHINEDTFREWNPFRSKLAAGFKKGIKLEFKKGSTILYLGSAEGQTVLHVSDIVGNEGIIFCVDLSEIAMQKLNSLAEKRENLFPILSDANKIENYEEYLEDGVDVLFQDVSQRNQTEIFLKNAKFLKKNCFAGLSLKTKSISQDDSKKTLEIEKKKLEEEFIIEQVVSLEPFEKEHFFILVRKK
jgi:fibrillarin-like pre-rRNA processing protein